MQAQRITYYDSMAGEYDAHVVLNSIHRYLCDEHLCKKGNPLPPGWEKEDHTHFPCPQQSNGYDCGVFMCMFMEFLSLGRPLDFGQEEVDAGYRKYIAEAIIRKALPLQMH